MAQYKGNNFVWEECRVHSLFIWDVLAVRAVRREHGIAGLRARVFWAIDVATNYIAVFEIYGNILLENVRKGFRINGANVANLVRHV